MRALATAVILSSFTGLGCWGPWYTTIPTYWDPVPTPPREASAEAKTPPPPPSRVAVPPVDDAASVYVAPDTPVECLSIYLVSSERALLSFDPRRKSFEVRGALRCPGAGFTSPFSMAVARDGWARVLYNDGRMYRVQVADATCEATDFQPDQPPGFHLFGMGYAPDPERGAQGETLYVAETGFGRPSRGLARVDTATGRLEHVGAFSHNPGTNIELTPTGDGPLFGFFINERAPGGTLVELDTASGLVLRATPLPIGTQSSSLAISWWGGSFYIFTGRGGRGTQVHRFDPSTKALRVVATTTQTIVGAGVSTCAPTGRRPGQPLRRSPTESDGR